MSLTATAVKEKVRAAALERLRGGPRTRRQNAAFGEELRSLGNIASTRSASAAWTDVLLVRAIIELQSAVAADRADPDRALALALGREAWYTGKNRIWPSLLLVGERAGRDLPDVAERVSTLLLDARPKNPKARAVRKSARAALDKKARPDAWRDRAKENPHDAPTAALLAELIPADQSEDGWFGVEEALVGGTALAPAAAGELRRAYLGDDSAPRAYVPTMRATVARGLVQDLPLAGLSPVLDASALDDAGRPDLVDVETVNLSGLRQYLDGRSVCLVANSADLLEHELGPQIDSYDVVVRFNSFAVDAPRTGTKTDVHATIHLHDYNWDVPVDVRVVFGGDPAAWARNVRRHTRPDAQRLLGDDSLRWPRRTLLGAALQERCPVPTSGFNMLLLLDHLDVSSRIDLFGFNFHSGAPYRREEAMHLPIATAHSYDLEREWVAARTVDTAPGRISLR